MSTSVRLGVISLSILLSACMVGPDYHRPELTTPVAFKHVEGWSFATPADEDTKGEWWRRYHDVELNQLVEKLNQGNQTVAQYEAQYRQAFALAQSSRGALWPQLTTSAGKTRAGQGTGSSTSSQAVQTSGIRTTYTATLNASWELDIWGRLRRTLEANQASADASAATLAAMRLSMQSELVQNYLQIRVMDQQKRLLSETVDTYKRVIQLTESQYKRGIVASADVAAATTQLKNAEAELVDLVWQRAQLENAIAVLIGEAPANFSLAETEAVPQLPEIPVSVPSQLLERRPDVAAAERSVMSANASIGVAKAAYYPSLSLSASGGYRSSTFNDWITMPNRYWSVGPQLAMTLFDGFQTKYGVKQSEASYDASVASYRQTVLTAFREVEDYLVALHTLGDESVLREQALAAAKQSLKQYTNQYRVGLIGFLDVVTAQTTALSAERTLLTLQQSRLINSVQLIAALGGGWEGLSVQD
ncbi:efflux transporter, outer membrane factor (OMF) lipoprotein, NodT family [Methylobacillus rhizosphaerae]|uniref:Efflux transporter, outer membrane factor (OMF) lipoprotein, NodT family n=1 Tax=Methylobacillus rhizosphaerae TaxID=551994 RepID=A0A239AHI0_9PROT|nr:efflux transporter outer membrane subunit [Methylobacillus rhizosphaerae]SNR94468.1 efflux transporter, outer membrane factor (OMF) lipoprotein, NodT family [Methylobacillus rhizosphaerae]